MLFWRTAVCRRRQSFLSSGWIVLPRRYVVNSTDFGQESLASAQSESRPRHDRLPCMSGKGGWLYGILSIVSGLRPMLVYANDQLAVHTGFKLSVVTRHHTPIAALTHLK